LLRKFQSVVQADLPSVPLLELRFFTVQSAALRDTVGGVDQVYASLKHEWFATPPAGSATGSATSSAVRNATVANAGQPAA
ncbi:hypothetical protein ABTF01_21820, partial [Acinetobacter baumannii]